MNYLIYSAKNEYEAHFIKMILDHNGIACDIKNINTLQLRPHLPRANPEVWIYHLAEIENAKKIINDELNEKKIFCEDAREKKCVFCKELSPSNFSECWKCQKKF